MNNVALKESCYACRYANRKRVGDITIGDFLGRLSGKIRTQHPSIVLVNSDKGEEHWKELVASAGENLAFEECERELAISRQFSLLRPAEKNESRPVFLREYDQTGFSKAVFQACKEQMYKDRIQEVLQIIGKIKQKLKP